jgi:hypothetical protein
MICGFKSANLQRESIRAFPNGIGLFNWHWLSTSGREQWADVRAPQSKASAVQQSLAAMKTLNKI